MNKDVVSRIKEFMEYKSLNSLMLANELGYKSSEKISRLFRDGKAKPSYDIIYDISNMFEINVDWLITGRGKMLRNSETPEDGMMGTIPTNSALPTEESIIYKMYREKDEENKALIRENGRLEERIRQLESQEKEPETPSLLSLTDSFTDKSFGDYGEGYLPTNPPRPSKKSSAGKM